MCGGWRPDWSNALRKCFRPCVNIRVSHCQDFFPAKTPLPDILWAKFLFTLLVFSVLHSLESNSLTLPETKVFTSSLEHTLVPGKQLHLFQSSHSRINDKRAVFQLSFPWSIRTSHITVMDCSVSAATAAPQDSRESCHSLTPPCLTSVRIVKKGYKVFLWSGETDTCDKFSHMVAVMSVQLWKNIQILHTMCFGFCVDCGGPVVKTAASQQKGPRFKSI